MGKDAWGGDSERKMKKKTEVRGDRYKIEGG